jgi:hypothetical protein
MPEELIPIVLFISIAAVAIFRPLTTRIGKVIEQAQAKKSVGQDPQIQRIMQLMERLVDRMDLLERERKQTQLTDGPGRGEAGEQRRAGRARPDDPI